MSDGSVIRLKCPLCGAEVVAQPDQAGHLITCDFCLEEFTAPETAAASPVAAKAKPGAPADSSDEQWLHADEDLTTPDEDLTTPDEDLTTPDEDLPVRKAVRTSDYEFSGPCPLCGTRYVATDDQIGRTIRCPDCHSKFEILEPLPGARQPLRRGGSSRDDDDEFRLSEPDDLFGIRAPTDDPLGSLDALDTGAALPLGNSVRPLPTAASWPRDDPGTTGHGRLAEAALRQAEAELDAREVEERGLPPNPLTNGLLKCFADPSLLIRWLLLALALQVDISAVNGAIARAMINDAMAQFLSLMMGTFAFLFGVGILVSGSVTLLTITQDTASGRDRIESWPNANFIDWVFDAFFVVCALVACLVVGAVTGQVFRPFGLVIYAWGLVISVGLSVAIVFPIYLLAALETGLAVNPISGPVFRSLNLVRGTWIQFSCISVGLAVVAVLGWQVRHAESAILNFVAAAIAIGVLMVYFRLLGRLTWICQEAIADDDHRREAAS